MKLKYTLKRLSGGVDIETLKVCDKGAKAMQFLLVRTAWITNKKVTPLMWILTRFYKRIITKEAIEYDFYLLKHHGSNPYKMFWRNEKEDVDVCKNCGDKAKSEEEQAIYS